jgi:polar amino acid transport system substrate-binding protein
MRLLFLLFIFLLSNLQSQDMLSTNYKNITIEIIAPEISTLIEEDGSGIYQSLFSEAAKRSNITIIEHFYPQKRAIEAFLNKEHLYIYAYTDLAIEKLGTDNILSSYPLGIFKQYIFTEKDDEAFVSISQLKGLKVGGVLGDEFQPWYENFTKEGIALSLVRRNEQNITMLEMGRIDAFVSFLPDINEYTYKLSYSIDSPLLVSYDRITSYNTPEAKEVLQRISKTLIEMKHDGSMEKILGSFYLEYDENEIPF